MPRELRIMATITLPDDEWDEAEAMTKLKPHIRAFEEATGVKVATERGEAAVPRVRKPRQSKVTKPEPAPLAAVA